MSTPPEMLAMMEATEALHDACDKMQTAFRALCVAADAAIDAEFARRNAALDVPVSVLGSDTPATKEDANE